MDEPAAPASASSNGSRSHWLRRLLHPLWIIAVLLVCGGVWLGIQVRRAHRGAEGVHIVAHGR